MQKAVTAAMNIPVKQMEGSQPVGWEIGFFFFLVLPFRELIGYIGMQNATMRPSLNDGKSRIKPAASLFPVDLPFSRPYFIPLN
jgi:hypothetical protein